MLTQAQIVSFKRDGCLVFQGMYDDAAVSAISQWSDDILGWPEEPGRHIVYHEDSLIEQGGRFVSRVENICPFHDGFDKLMTEGALIDAVSQLLDDKAVLFKEKINMKMPGGDGFKPHQDA